MSAAQPQPPPILQHNQRMEHFAKQKLSEVLQIQKETRTKKGASRRVKLRSGSKVESSGGAGAPSTCAPSGTTLASGTLQRINSKTDRHTLLASIKRAAQASTGAAKMLESGGNPFQETQKPLGGRRRTAAHVRAASELVAPLGAHQTQKNIQTINFLESSDQANELMVGRSSNYSYNKDQLARHTSWHKQVLSMNQTLNRILPQKSSKQIDLQESLKEDGYAEQSKGRKELADQI